MKVTDLLEVLTYEGYLSVSVNRHLYKDILVEKMDKKYADFNVLDITPTEGHLYLDITNGGSDND